MRQFINRYPKTVVAMLCAVVAALGYAAMTRLRSGASTPGGVIGPKWWYSTDGGSTFFADQAGKLVPFQHDGKTAYRCYVWSCDGGKTRFASHLERIRPDAEGRLAGRSRVDPIDVPPGAWQVKAARVPDAPWIDASALEAAEVVRPKCPDGGTPQLVLAE